MSENENYEDRLAAWEKWRVTLPPEPEQQPFAPTFTDMVSLHDGVRLYTEVFCPRGVRIHYWIPTFVMRSHIEQ